MNRSRFAWGSVLCTYADNDTWIMFSALLSQDFIQQNCFCISRIPSL